MPSAQTVIVTLDRRLLEHPRAYHLRRMRQGVWLYLDLLARLPVGDGTIEVDPVAIGEKMGLSEGTIRSWLGHLRKAGYIKAERLNGSVRVSVKRDAPPTAAAQPATPKERVFTLPRLVRALGESDQKEALQAVLNLYPDRVIRRALTGTLKVPEDQIRRSRTALFLYLVKRYAEES